MITYALEVSDPNYGDTKIVIADRVIRSSNGSWTRGSAPASAGSALNLVERWLDSLDTCPDVRVLRKAEGQGWETLEDIEEYREDFE